MASLPQWCQLSKRSLIALALGQFLALLIALMGIMSQALASKSPPISIPTSQSFLNYLLLFLVYVPLLLQRDGLNDVWKSIKEKWWRYFILGVIDVEANFLVVMAYQDTSLTSVQLLDSFSIPVVMVLTLVFLHVRYHWLHLGAVVLCLGGLTALVLADAHSSEAGSSRAPLRGDMFCLVGATLYGVSNVAQEWLVLKYDRLEFLAFLGMGAVGVSGIQAGIIDHRNLASMEWTNDIVGYLLGFSFSLFLFYSLVPHMLKLSGAAMLNISLLMADIYSLIAGILIFKLSFKILYFIGFSLMVVGIFLYNVREPVRTVFDVYGDLDAEMNITDDDNVIDEEGGEMVNTLPLEPYTLEHDIGVED